MRAQIQRFQQFIFFFLFIILILWVGFGLVEVRPNQEGLHLSTHIRWLMISVILVVFLGVMGQQIRGRPAGVLIDSRNKISLSRFQMTLWTVLIMSAFLTIGLARSRANYLRELTPDMVAACEARLAAEQAEVPGGQSAAAAAAEETCVVQPLQIAFPVEIVAALGISAASLAGSSLIKQTKRGTEKSSNTIMLIQDKERELKNLHDQAVDRLAALENRMEEAREELRIADTHASEYRERLESALTDEDVAELRTLSSTADAEVQRLESELAALQSERTLQEQRAEESAKRLEMFVNGQRTGQGLQHRNATVEQATWSDMFRGEEITNYEILDISKVQMFFFTIAVVFTYGALMFTFMQDEAQLRNPLGLSFPAVTASLNYLLLISHAGYLTLKFSDNA